MHEVLAPFVALSDPELPTSDISLCYGAFIKRFLPYAFNKDEEFLSLQVFGTLDMCCHVRRCGQGVLFHHLNNVSLHDMCKGCLWGYR